MNAKPSKVRRAAVACLLLASLSSGCNRDPAPAATTKAEKPKAESDLSRTTISRTAQQMEGLKTTPVRLEPVQEQRTLTGWVMVRPGDEVSVTAPVGGYLRAPAAPAVLPTPGLAVRAGQELFRLEPVLSPLDQTNVAALRRGIEGELAKAKDAVTQKKNEWERVKKLFNQTPKLRGERDVELAETQYKASKSDYDTALDKLKAIAVIDSDKGELRLAPLKLHAPRAGIALAVLASPGQYVAVAAPLATIADLSRPWVRVPVPEFDLPRLDRGRSALVTVFPEGPGNRGAPPNGAPLQLHAEPVALVPQVDPIKHTADLIYELKLPSEHATLAKDQMVVVAVPVGKRAEEAVVPYSAVVFDAYGGSWVYVDRTAKDAETCVYERLRVELGPPVGADVVVRPPLRAGESVVSEGVAALFSREFFRPPVVVPEAPKGK